MAVSPRDTTKCHGNTIADDKALVSQSIAKMVASLGGSSATDELMSTEDVLLVSTGRGSYRRFKETTLAEILKSYDNAPPEFRDETRDEVIAHWRLVEARVKARKAKNDVAEAMPKITRRGMMAAMTAVTVPPVAHAGQTIVTPTTTFSPETAENPKLVAAYDRFLQASAEVTAAKEALEWLAAEWRHLWPLAPEELLDGAGADSQSSRAERDIIGNLVKRDTSGLTTRFSRKQREQTPNTCFSIITADEASNRIKWWSATTPKGRTDKALERNRAQRDRFISEHQRKLPLARQYEAETSRLRAEAGVEEAKKKIAAAKLAVRLACSDISNERAFTVAGLRLKAEAIAEPLKEAGLFNIEIQDNIFGEMARFIDGALNFGRI